jgi:hypothetical protein
MERQKVGKLAATALAGAAFLSGCAENQVHGINVVNCATGPREGNATVDLPYGSELKIGTGGFAGYPVYLRIEDEGTISLVDNGSRDNVTKILRNENGNIENIQNSRLEINRNGDIFVRDNDKLYKIQVEDREQNAQVSIDVSCTNQEPTPTPTSTN